MTIQTAGIVVVPSPRLHHDGSGVTKLSRGGRLPGLLVLLGPAAAQVHADKHGPEPLPKQQVDEAVGGEVEVEQDLEHPLQDHVSVGRMLMLNVDLDEELEADGVGGQVEGEEDDGDDEEEGGHLPFRSQPLLLPSLRGGHESLLPLKGLYGLHDDGDDEEEHEDGGEDEGQRRVYDGGGHDDVLEVRQARAVLGPVRTDLHAGGPEREVVEEGGGGGDASDHALGHHDVAVPAHQPGLGEADEVLHGDAHDEPHGQASAHVREEDGDLAHARGGEQGHFQSEQPDDEEGQQEADVVEGL